MDEKDVKKVLSISTLSSFSDEVGAQLLVKVGSRILILLIALINSWIKC